MLCVAADGHRAGQVMGAFHHITGLDGNFLTVYSLRIDFSGADIGSVTIGGNDPVGNLIRSIRLCPQGLIGRIVVRQRGGQQIYLALLCISVQRNIIALIVFAGNQVPAQEYPARLDRICHRHISAIADIDGVRAVTAVAIELHQIVIALVIHIKHGGAVRRDNVRLVIKRSKASNLFVGGSRLGHIAGIALQGNRRSQGGILHIQVIVNVLEIIVDAVIDLRRAVLHLENEVFLHIGKVDLDRIIGHICAVLRNPAGTITHDHRIGHVDSKIRSPQNRGHIGAIGRGVQLFKLIGGHTIGIHILHILVLDIMDLNGDKVQFIFIQLHSMAAFALGRRYRGSAFLHQVNGHRVGNIGIGIRIGPAAQPGRAVRAQDIFHQRQGNADVHIRAVVNVDPNAILLRVLHLPLVLGTCRQAHSSNGDFFVLQQVQAGKEFSIPGDLQGVIIVL